MHSLKERKSRKLESLPEDLRSIADELISEKFPEPVMGIDMARDADTMVTYIGTPYRTVDYYSELWTTTLAPTAEQWNTISTIGITAV